MSEPEESQESGERTSPIVAPPTANPSRVRVPPEGLDGRSDEGEPGESGTTPGEEA